MKLFLLAAPYDSGHYKKRLGVGPLVLLDGLCTQLVNDGHTVRKEELSIDTSFTTEITTSFEVSRKVATQVSAANARGEFPIVFSGNCNAAAVGVISGLKNDCGVIWFDCHGDFNTPETTIGGYLDGMALSMITGECWAQLTASVPGFKPVPENKVVVMGARDLDPLEEQRLQASYVTLISADKLKEKHYVVENDLVEMQSVYLHIDLDVIDPAYVKVNTYAKPGGLFPETLYEIVSIIKKRYKISGIGFTSYDPSLDPDRKVVAVVKHLFEIVI